MNLRKGVFVILGMLTLAGCGSMGPPTIPKDRFDYNSAVSNSWKDQTLLNIVKFRYMDPPVFLEVAQIISGYTLEGSLSAGGTLSSEGAIQGDFFNLGAAGKYTDRPTITYSPMTGVSFMKSLMIPIEPANIFLLIHAGWPAGRIFQLAVQTINGVSNRYGGSAMATSGDPEFFRMTELLDKIQKTNHIGMRIEKQKDGRSSTVLLFPQKRLGPDIQAAAAEVRKILGLKMDAHKFNVVFGAISQNDEEIALQTRSMAQILIDLAAYVGVPEIHLAEKRATPGHVFKEEGFAGPDVPLRIYSGKERSPFAFSAVRYRDHWFWIDDRDLRSKSTFALISFIFAFAEAGSKEGVPLVTIPAG